MINMQKNIPLAPLTSFDIGGETRYMIEVKNEIGVREAIAWAREQNVPFFILAGGSNVLAPDDGFDGLVIRIVHGEYELKDGILSTDTGCNLLVLIREASSKRWGGWEKMSGIPGTIGGAVRGNAGAFGTEIKDVVQRVDAFSIETGETRSFTNEECAFSYRQSFFKQHSEWIITKVVVALVSVEPVESTQLIETTIAEREKRHLQNVRAAGSFFMNPIAPQHIIEMFENEKQMLARAGRVPAGWLIEKAGMKGVRVGDAQASEQHPNYIVNTGNATAVDVSALAHSIKKAVREQFDIELQEEAVLW